MFVIKALRFFLIMVGLMLVAVPIAAFVFSGELYDFGARAAERSLSATMTVPVTVEAVSVSLFNSTLELHGVAASNPQDFKDGPAIECERLLTEFDFTTFFNESPTIKRLNFEGTRVHLRHEIGRGTNIGRIIAQIDEAEEQSKTGGREYLIENLRSEDARVVLSTNLIPLSRVGVRVITIDLTDVNSAAPVSRRDIAMIFLRSVLVEAITIKGLLRPVIDNIKEEIAEMREQREREIDNDSPFPFVDID